MKKSTCALVIIVFLLVAALAGQNQVGAQGGTWTTKASMPTGRIFLAAGVINDVLYAVGGQNSLGILDTVEAYDTASDSWTTKTPMPTARGYLAAEVIDGILYAVGGWSYPALELTTLEAYDPTTNTWTAKASMPTARHSLGVGVVNGILYAIGGGYTGGGGCATAMATVEAYDPFTDSWTAKAPMPTARYGLSVGVINGMIYAVGGLIGSNCDLVVSTVEAYDPNTDTWSTRASIPTARLNAASGVLNGRLYVIGGCGVEGCIARSTNEAYSPATNTWTTEPPMPTPRMVLTGAVGDQTLYAIGGLTGVWAEWAIVDTVEAFTLVVEVSIDIKPGSYPNSINLKSKGVVPVAVLGSASFDVSTIDPSTVLFAGAAAVRWAFEDVNGDGFMDMVFHFRTQGLALSTSSTEATLTGQAYGGQQFQGTDSVKIVH